MWNKGHSRDLGRFLPAAFSLEVICFLPEAWEAYETILSQQHRENGFAKGICQGFFY